MSDSALKTADAESGVHIHEDVEALNRWDRREPLFAARKRIHPKRATGQFRRLKWIIMLITLGIYYVTPWLRWDRGPFAPDQAVLIDLANRRFYFFFIEIWPQEFFFVAGMLIMAGLGLFLITSVAGRVWCGYTCPQTVWVDLFIAVERFIEGDRNARIALDAAPMSASKFTKRSTKFLVWFLVALSTGGAWVFYFADAPTLLRQLVTFSAPTVAYATIAILTFTTLWLGAFMREQVCTYMCPWPRIQGAMLDENSLTVTYNDWRGEPRTKHRKKALAADIPAGDCIDCNACVAVCPMGIDIRDGSQLECITCALCIDACNNVMDKVGLDRGLISYTTLKDYDDNMHKASNAAGEIDPALVHDADGHIKRKFQYFDWGVIFRFRSVAYFVIWAAIGIGIVTALAMRDAVNATITPSRNPLYVQLSDGGIQNSYEVKISNRRHTPRLFTVTLVDFVGGSLSSTGLETIGEKSVLLSVDADKVRSIRVSIKRDAAYIDAEEMPVSLVVRDLAGGESAILNGEFLAPQTAVKK